MTRSLTYICCITSKLKWKLNTTTKEHMLASCNVKMYVLCVNKKPSVSSLCSKSEINPPPKIIWVETLAYPTAIRGTRHLSGVYFPCKTDLTLSLLILLQRLKSCCFQQTFADHNSVSVSQCLCFFCILQLSLSSCFVTGFVVILLTYSPIICFPTPDERQQHQNGYY